MSKVVRLDEHRPIKALYSLMVYQNPDGSIYASPDWADDDWVETNGGSVSERMSIIASHMPEITQALLEQVEEFKMDGPDE